MHPGTTITTGTAVKHRVQAVVAAQVVGFTAVIPARIAVSHATNPAIAYGRSIVELTHIAAFTTIERIVQYVGSTIVARITKRGRAESVLRVFGHTDLSFETGASGGTVTGGRAFRVSTQIRRKGTSTKAEAKRKQAE